MNKKRFTDFSKYLEDFTQRIVQCFPDSSGFIENEKAYMLERFPELASVQPKSRPSQISVIEYTLTSSLNNERRKSYVDVEDDIKRSTPEACVDSVNLLSKAIGNAHKDVLFYSSLQGDLLSCLKDICGPSFPVLLRNNINISRSHAFSHPSNPIHKAEVPNPIHKDQNLIPPQFKQKKIKKSEENHEILKVGVFMGAAISAFAVYRMF